MITLAIRAATAEDIPAIVQVRLASLGDEKITGFSAAESPLSLLSRDYAARGTKKTG